MAKVSVIVPVYNTHNTLIDCLSNLVNQSLQDIEIITVNDGSTDDSYDILLECERQFPEKMMVIDLEENVGVGGARNVGLMYASGDYIGFCDSDDVVDTTMYEKLYREASLNNLDMVDCGYLDERDGKAYLRTGDNVIGELDAAKRSELIATGGYIFSRIYKREIWSEIQFRTPVILEDMETLMMVFMKCERIGSVKEILYKYRDNSGSLSKMIEPKKYHHAVVSAIAAIRDTVMKHEKYDEVQEAVEYSLTHLCAIGVVNTYNYKNALTTKERECMREELLGFRKSLIKIDIESNKYSVAKIDRQDREVLG